MIKMQLGITVVLSVVLLYGLVPIYRAEDERDGTVEGVKTDTADTVLVSTSHGRRVKLSRTKRWLGVVAGLVGGYFGK